MGGLPDARMAIGAGSFGGLGSPRELIGYGLDGADATAVLSRAVDLGLAIIDTAHSYADGAADQIVGAWLAADAARAGQVAVVAKLGVLVSGGGLTVDLRPDTVERCARETRARLGVSKVAVVMSHAPDESTPVTVTLDAFLRLIEDGYADAYGVSNVDITVLETWLAAADRVGAPPPVVVENEYHLLRRDDEQHVLPLCRERGIDYLAHSPLAGGLLTGKYRSGATPPAGSYLSLRPDDRLDLLASLPVGALRGFVAEATRRGVSAAALGLAWVAAQAGVRPIVGVRLPAQLDAAEQALDHPISVDDASRIARLFTGV